MYFEMVELNRPRIMSCLLIPNFNVVPGSRGCRSTHSPRDFRIAQRDISSARGRVPNAIALPFVSVVRVSHDFSVLYLEISHSTISLAVDSRNSRSIAHHLYRHPVILAIQHTLQVCHRRQTILDLWPINQPAASFIYPVLAIGNPVAINSIVKSTFD